MYEFYLSLLEHCTNVSTIEEKEEKCLNCNFVKFLWKDIQIWYTNYYNKKLEIHIISSDNSLLEAIVYNWGHITGSDNIIVFQMNFLSV